MHPDFYQLLELAMGLIVLFGLGMGVKVLVWDRLPSRRFREAMEQRIAELEERYDTLLDLHERHVRQLEDHDERLDFNERLLARGGSGITPPIETPELATPV
ncbi:MAG: hypothetical protein GTO22_08000 [Gemmatimonadales bacterium]|nr:hypothetical protein [Gemmatimonadales bacterium]